MDEKEFNEILSILEKGTELNIGLLPNTNIVKYGFDYWGKYIKLFLQVSNKDIDIINDFIKLNIKINFNKYSGKGNYFIGDGYIKKLEDEDNKLDALNYIIKQHHKNNIEYEITLKNIEEYLIFELEINNIHLIKNE